MSRFCKMASALVLPLSIALLGTGCMAQPDDEDQADQAGAQAAAPEKTGETSEAQFGFGGCGFGGFGCGCGFPWFNGIATLNALEGAWPLNFLGGCF